MATVKQLPVRLTESDIKALETIMETQGQVSMAEAIRFAIRQWVLEHPQPPKKKPARPAQP